MAVDTLARTIAAAKARGGGGSGLPAVTSDDNGDVLTVVNGEWDKAAASGGLPAVTSSDNGNVLAVVSGAWAKSSNALPSVNVYDYGKILSVSSNGKWVALSTPMLPSVTASDNGKIMIVVNGNWMKRDFLAVIAEPAFEDEQTPGKYVCERTAGDLYDLYFSMCVVIQSDVTGNANIINAEEIYDDELTPPHYKFTVMIDNNGTPQMINFTANSPDDHPSYTAS